MSEEREYADAVATVQVRQERTGSTFTGGEFRIQ